MCGRYASSRRPEDLLDEFEVTTPRIVVPLAPDWNVAPSKEVYAVLERPLTGSEETPERQLRVLTWGLIPSWSKDPAASNRLINARVETVAEKPAFRKAFATQRCLLPADGYYEWYTTARPGRAVKQPFFIRPRSEASLAMAGLYEIWVDPALPATDPARFRWTCTVITTRASDPLGHLHDRMPLMVEPEGWSEWLDPRPRRVEDLRELLSPAVPGELAAYPVSSAVGNVRNNGPGLIAPLPLDAEVQVLEADPEALFEWSNE